MSSSLLPSTRRKRAIGVLGAAAIVAASIVSPSVLSAQGRGLVARADTLMLAGRVFAAESLYYRAAALEPRNPTARLALGRYLAQRGALRVGAVLMEEARYFGGDASIVAVELAPVYQRLDDYAALAALPGSPLPVGERLRAEWLRDNPPNIDGPDSAWVAYRVTDSKLLGRVPLKIGTDSVLATIDARVQGLQLDTSWAKRKTVRIFAGHGERDVLLSAAVVPTVRIGAMTLDNVPTRFATLHGPLNAAIGLDVLGKLAPSFDPRAGRILLRRTGKVTDPLPGWSIATLTTGAGVYVVKGETVFPLGHPDVQQYLRNVRWTFNPRRGEIVVDSVDASQSLGAQ